MSIRFDTASITKLFTSVAVLQLIDRGLLSFDTAVIDFLGLIDTAISPEVTVYQLLTNSSGIGDDVEEEDGEDCAKLWKTRPNFGVTTNVVCYQKEGVNAGVSGIIRHFPDRDISVVLLSNMESGVWKPVWKIHELIIDGRLDSTS